MMRSRKTLQWFYYLQVVSILAHNIIRLPDTRQARFVLRHIDRVHAAGHFSELTVYSEQVCADKCVSHSSCKSFNYYDVPDSDDNTCQLVAEDVNDRYEYVARAGWKHFDTGRSMLTRIVQHSTGYCYYVENGPSCNNVATTDIELRSGSECDWISAYFEYDRDSGIIKHYCTGKLLCATSDGSGIEARSFDASDTCRGSWYIPGVPKRKWRLGFQRQLEFAGKCWSSIDATPAIHEDAIASSSVCYGPEAKIILKDIDYGPVRVYIWYNTNHNEYNNIVGYIKGLGSPQGYKNFNDFSWYKSWDKDWFAIRMQAIFRAPETGVFTFKLTADDFAVLYIHDCLTCTSKKTAGKSTESSCFDCLDHPASGTYTYSMVKETKYYFNLYYLEVDGDDSLCVYMKTPTQSNWIPVSFNHLESYSPDL